MEKVKQRFDLMGAIDDLEKIKVSQDGTDRLIIAYPTQAVFEAQKAWMEDRLEEKKWIKGLEESFEVEVIDSGFICNNGKYSFSLAVSIPRSIQWSAVRDDGFRSRLFAASRKYFAEKIVEDYPLPFSVDFRHIALKPYVECRYFFSYYHCPPAALPKHANAIINEEEFKESIKKAIDENGGFFLGIRTGETRKKIPVLYLELTRRSETVLANWSPGGDYEEDTLSISLNRVLNSFFGDRMTLYPCCEKDIN